MSCTVWPVLFSLGALNFGKFDVICHAQTRFLLEFVGQIIFSIAHLCSQIGGADFFLQMHFNVVHALLHLLAKVRVCAAFMHTAHKIIIHDQRKRVQIVHGFGIFSRLMAARHTSEVNTIMLVLLWRKTSSLRTGTPALMPMLAESACL